MQLQLSGQYFDGITSNGCSAELQLNGQTIEVSWAEGRQVIDVHTLAVEAALGSVPRKVTWGAEAYFVSTDHSALEDLAARTNAPSTSAWIGRLESSFVSVAAAAVFCVVFLVVVAVYVVPTATSAIAVRLPASVSQQMAATTLANLDQVFDRSQLASARQDQLREYFGSHGGKDIEVFFRREQRFVGANALTLSSTTMVFTDAIVALMENDEHLLAVYLHELGHARMHHVEQTLLQTVGWAVVLTFITGDIGGVGELILTLPLTLGQAAYSREYERQADAFAVAELQRYGIDPEVFAQALEQLERSHTGASESGSADGIVDKSMQVQRSILEFLSSHPVTRERIAAIRSASD